MSWLGAGAGAAQGLEELLTRQRAEELMRQNAQQHAGQLAETVRSNQAHEAFQGRQLDENTATRNQQMQLAHEDKQAADQEKSNALTMGHLNMRAIGDPVSIDERAKELGAGAPASLYQESNGPELPPGSEGPRLPMIKFRGTGPQLQQQQFHTDQLAQQDTANARADQTHQDAVDQRKATDASTAEQRKFTNSIATDRLGIERQRLADAEKNKAEAANTIKLGEGGKRSLRSLDQAAPLIDRVLSSFPKDMEDPAAAPDANGTRINQKYNTVGNKLGNLVEYGKYKLGFQDENSPIIQLEKLLQPVQAGQYLAGSRNYQMVELALAHLSDPTLTDAERYVRLKNLKQLMPELRQAIIDSETPQQRTGTAGPRAGAGAAPAGTGGGSTPLKVGRFTIEPE